MVHFRASSKDNALKQAKRYNDTHKTKRILLNSIKLVGAQNLEGFGTYRGRKEKVK